MEVAVIRILMVVLLAMGTSSAWGQELKVGFVNVQKAISQSKRGEKARETFQSAVRAREQALRKEQAAIQEERKTLAKQAVLMKEAERARAQRRIQRLVRDYERKTRDVREELAVKEREMTDEILKDLQKIIAEVGKTGKFTMILERSQLLYTDKGTDITDDVVKLYNERFQDNTAGDKKK